jgi:hypothetical protein
VSSLGKKLTSFVAAVLTVLGGIVSLMTLYPRVTATISFDTKTPLSSSFLVSNDGFLPVYSVSVACLMDYVDVDTPPTIARKAVLGGPFALTEIPVITLDPGAKESVPFSDCVTTPLPLTGAHVGLRVTYRPMLWPGNRTFAQEFYAKDIGNNTFFWYSVPYSK